jgi:AcrR family transcriptional regulator
MAGDSIHHCRMKSKDKRLSPDRDATYWKVLNAALELDFKRGHMKWTMSELARKSAITRSLIYYHFGRSKIAILEEAVRVIGEEVIGASAERIKMWQDGDWLGSVKQARAVSLRLPNLANFYLLHRTRPTELGHSIKKIEDSYFKKLETFFPLIPPAGRSALFAVFFGLAFGPYVDDEALKVAVNALKTLVP